MPQSRKYVVKVTNRSGFDKSHRNTLTLKCGTITPILCDELIPGSRVNLKLNLACQLAPLVSDTFMNVKLKAEAFFVPSRLLLGSFEDFYCDSEDTQFVGVLADNSTGHSTEIPRAIGTKPNACVPKVAVNALYTSLMKEGSLCDYLGLTIDNSISTGTLGYFNILPLIAYHLVWQEWYRNPRVQKPAFVRWIPDGSTVPSAKPPISSFPYAYFHSIFNDGQGNTIPSNEVYSINSTPGTSSNVHTLADGKNIFMLRQRNFGSDYFTNARVNSQQGDMSRVEAPDNIGGNAEFTIAALRLMNSLQQYKERNNIPSSRMVDVTLNRYGVKMSDGVAQRPICLGSASYDVYSRGVDQTAPIATSSYNGSPNIFKTVGTVYGKAHAAGSDFIIDDFEAKEPGYLLVNVTLVPEATYTAGIKRMFTRYLGPGTITDMANPLLQNVGDQPVYAWEVTGAVADYQTVSPTIFGYQDRYADWMFCPNEVHGQLRAGSSLASFVLQRNIAAGAQLSTSFLEIPSNYLDSVMVSAINSGNTPVSPAADLGFAAWLDSMLQYRVSMPLAEFSVPSLQNPAYEHGKTVVLNRNGQIF